MDMEGETLPAGSSVTVTKTTSPEGNLLFVIGVPQGIQGDKGDTGETGATGPQGVSVANATVNEDGDLVITLSSGNPINAGSVIGPQGIQGEVGPTGASVDRIERTSGTGAPGTTDTYTVYLTDGQTGGTFQVYNGSNGTGSGDFMADGSVPMTGDLQMGGHKITNLAEPTDNTDAASKEYVDDTITVSLVGNYIPMGQKGQANGVASLDDSGKVPSAQLPPMDYVPTSRTVNGHALSADVTLDADDVGAIPNPSGGTAGQVLTKTADGSAWEDAPSGLPDGGADGQMLYKSADGAAWGDKPVMIVNATDAEDASLTTDKTLDEIKEAYLNDVNIFIKYTDVLLPLVLAENVEGENPSFKFFNYSTNTISGDLYALIEAEIEIFRHLGEDFAYFYIREGGLVPTDGNQGEMLYCDNTGRSHWGPAPKGIPSGGTTGQVLTKTSTGEEWSDAPSGLPEGGTEGQVLKRGASGAEWGNPVGKADQSDPTGEIFNDYERNEATGEYSHAEGWRVIASGMNSHAEGDRTEASGSASHAEGMLTTASGSEAHSEGSNTVASGGCSHAEGANTVASGMNQHAQGKFNIEDNSDTYAHIVGNGNSENTRSNAHTLDWDGNAWFAGDVFVGGSSQTSGDKLMKEPTGTQGQLLGFTADNTVGAVDSKSPTSVTITLTTSGWSSNTQTVTVSGVSASETAQLITPTPKITSQSAYYEAGIMCTGQAANSLTFTCQTVPTSNLTVYVVIQPLS